MSTAAYPDRFSGKSAKVQFVIARIFSCQASTGRSLLAIIAIAIAAFNCSGQTTGPLDRQTPLGLTPGAPVGSRIEDLASVNLFNGNLNFALPLATAGGRGEAGAPLMLTIERHWQVQTRCDLSVTGQLVCNKFLSSMWWGNQQVGYGPGILVGRGGDTYEMGQGTVPQCTPHGGTVFTFTDPSGTEHELRDSLTLGAPNWGSCDRTRGTNFISVDGSSITFVSDSVIDDNWAVHGPSPDQPTGYLLFASGTRYRVENGLVVSIRDRNGNKVSYFYETYAGTHSRVKTITDALGRTITVNYDINDQTYGLCDQVGLPGFGTMPPRIITITKTSLGGALRYDQAQLQTYGQLFPGFNWINGGTQFNPQIISGMYLPNGQSYKFYYNTYGELARIKVPTGGAIDYDYVGGLTNQPDSGAIINGNYIYRRVAAKRVFTSATDVNSKTYSTGYSRPENWISGTGTVNSLGFVSVEDRATDNSFLSYEKHYFYGSAASSFNTQDPYPVWKDGKEYQTEIFDTDLTTVIRRSTRNWQQRASVSWWSNYAASHQLNPNDEPANDPRVVETTQAIEPLGANLVSKVSAISPQTGAVGFDQHNNQTDVWEYGFGVGAPSAYAMRHEHTDYLTVNPVNNISYADPANGSSYTASDVHLRRLPRGGQIYSINPTSGIESLVAQSETRYDESANPLLTYGNVTSWSDPGAARGAATTIRNWLSTSNSWLEKRVQYDQCGNIRNIWDAKGNQSQIEYSSTQSAYVYPTLTRTAVPDPTGRNGSTTAFVTTSVYDFNTGLVTSTTDANNVTTTMEYNDPLNRPKRIVRALGSAVQSQSSISYDDVNHIVTTTNDQNTYNDGLLKSEVVYDGLGRTIEARQYEGDTNYIAVQTQYDAMGRAFKVSNPFRPWKFESPIWTTTGFDALSRVISVKTPDNAVVKTAYDGNRVLVADQNGSDQLRRKRISKTDALGRLKDVWEVTAADGATEPVSFPGWPDVTAGYHTSYEYDGLDNLTSATQGAQNPRSFTYDSLKRLTSASNPESGTVSYQYDENGNIRVKTDARGVSTHSSYDALNRVVRRWYNSSSSLTQQTNNNPALRSDVGTSDEVTYFYDLQTLPPPAPSFSHDYAAGRLVAITYGSGGSAGDYYSYDAVGGPVVKIQQTGATNYQISATYNLAGAMTSQTYTSGHRVNYAYDRAGRTNGVTGGLGDGRDRTYSSGITYSPFGGLTQEQFGTQTALFHKLHYNTRGQLYDVRASTLSLQADEFNWNRGCLELFYGGYAWGQSGPGNNGNITAAMHWVPANDAMSDYWYTQDNYSYDSLNRISATNEIHGKPNWQSGQDYVQTYDYDRWGNRTINPSSSGVNNTQFDKTDAQSTNRLYAPGDTSPSLPVNQRKMQYDPAGNLTHDSYTGDGRTRSYDAENRLSLLSFPAPPPPPPVCYPDGEGGQICYPVDDSGKFQPPPPIQYIYDGEGRRVRRFINNQETRQVYGFGGELLAEYAASTSPTTLAKEYGYRNGQLLITATPGSSSASIRLEPVTTGSSGDLLARIDRAELPAWIGGLLSKRTSTEAISDSSTPLYGPSFPYASLGSSVSPLMPQSGTSRIAFASNRDGSAQVYSMNTDGSGALRLTNDAANDESPRWSPNSSRIVFQSDRDNVFSGMADIYVMNGDGSGQTRLTSDAADDSAPVWSPNGGKIAFQSARSGVSYQVYAMNADGSAQSNLSNNGANDTQPSWSPDGTRIAFVSDRDQAGFSSIYVMNANGSNQTRLTFSGSGFRDEQPVWSPDGTKLAFTSTRDSSLVTWEEWDGSGSGVAIVKSKLLINKEVYVMNADGSAQVRVTNIMGNDDSPTWSSEGTKIAFRSDRERDCCDPTNQLWVMNADGTNQVNLSNNQAGDYSPSWSNLMVPPPPPNNSQFVSQSVPSTMIAGQSYAVSVRMKNTGSNTWTTASQHNLGSQNPQDNSTWGMGRVPMPFSVATGTEVTFNFTVTAPLTAGAYNFQWRMVQDGVAWFGDLTPNVVVTVNPQSGPNPNPPPDPTAPVADVRWIVTDQLGTPRMIFDQSGSLASVSRHDYLPFGEELTGQIGGRTTQQGYTGDVTRQKFTGYEADGETGLNFAQARYQSTVQGRFTGPDAYVIFFEMKRGRDGQEESRILRSYASEPQNWNRYAYCINDPVDFVDPSGLVWLTKDNENYQWVDDDKYKKEDWVGYEVAKAGTIAYFGGGWGGYPDKYKDLMSSYVTLNADGTLSSAGISDPPSSNSAGYTDINVSYGSPYFVGITGGLIFDRNGVYPYIGGGLMNPNLGGSVSVSNDQVSGGFNGELQGGYGPLYGSVGVDQEGNTFLSHGAGFGASATAYYVFGAPHPRPGPHKPSDNNALNSNSNWRKTDRPGKSNCACNSN